MRGPSFDEPRIRNAVIESAELSTEDHGVLSAWLSLDYGGMGQGFGGYVLCVDQKSPHYPGAGNFGGVFIRRVMDVVGVTKWSALKGKTCRVRCTHSSVEAIGHIIRDEWFEPGKEMEALRPASEAA